MEIDERAKLHWVSFGDLSTALLYEVLRFRQAIFVVEQASPVSRPRRAGSAARSICCCGSMAMLAGYLRLIPFADDKRVAIGRVAVAAALRRKGLGRRLIDEALARCRQDHPDRAITLSAQAYLARFYETVGFRVTSAPYDDYGVSHVDMVRSSST